jgi:hypothetical protein
MAAFTTSQSGNWNAAATWGGAGIPGSGDTATINHAVTIPSGYDAVVGTSPNDDTGAVALSINAGLTINGSLTWKGPVRQDAVTVTCGAGSRITYDATAASVPASALYSWGYNNAGAKIVLNGTSGAHVTINSAGNVASNGFGSDIFAPFVNYADGAIESTFADWSYQGNPASGGVMFVSRPVSSGVKVFFDDNTFDHCAQVQSGDIGGGVTWRCRRTKWANTTGGIYQFQLTTGNAKTTGERLFENCDGLRGGGVYFLVIGLSSSDFVIQNSLAAFHDPTSLGCEKFDQNFLVAFGDGGPNFPSGTLTNSGVLVFVDPSFANAHPGSVGTKGMPTDLGGWVYQYTGFGTASDIIEITGVEPSVDRVLRIHNCVFLPNPAGEGPGAFVNNSSGADQTHTKIYFEHNTAAGISGSGQTYGVGCESTTHWGAGAVPSIQSNLLWNDTGPSTMLLVSSPPGALIDDDAITVADYNHTFNASGTIYGPPANQYASTPGTHDSTGDPQFVDKTRSFLNFDQGYLGRPVATAWVTGHAYSVGDLISQSEATFYSGATYNYRCTAAHTSGSTTKPGSGATWTSKWEPAALKELSDSILAGATFSGGTNSLIGEMIAWIKAGFAPRNASLHNTAHDGTDKGAVAWTAGTKSPPPFPSRTLRFWKRKAA